MNEQEIYDFKRKLAKIYAQSYTGTETRPGEAYFYLKNIPLIIEECEKNDVTVWRIECFRTDGKYVQPSLYWIHDMPDKKDEEIWSEYRQRCNQEATDYLHNFREKNDVEPELDVLVTFLFLGKKKWEDLQKRKEKEEKKIINRIKTYFNKWFFRKK